MGGTRAVARDLMIRHVLATPPELVAAASSAERTRVNDLAVNAGELASPVRLDPVEQRLVHHAQRPCRPPQCSGRLQPAIRPLAFFEGKVSPSQSTLPHPGGIPSTARQVADRRL